MQAYRILDYNSSEVTSSFPVIAPFLRLERRIGLAPSILLCSRRKRRAAVLRTAVPGLFPRKWKMTKRRSQNQRRNHYRNTNTRRIAWDDLRAMTPLEPHTEFAKPPIGYILDEDGNYPERPWEVL